ncbi:Protein C19orf12 [Orchesella cincta]|uniref:Protein C19orf12 n=1 Tax=Orchesella cincta TaxID=48709 RepID=A0A1D2N2J3_ORCCI|nr:Protein C19orf12 [Orchesella cincta]
MPVNVHEIMEACELLARQDNLNLCIQESLKGATMAGFGSFIGGVLMGPVGIAVGATVGGVVGSSVCRHYQPLWQIIQEMNEADKDRFAKHMQKVLNDLDITDAVVLMTLVRDPTAMGRNAIVKELGNYFGQALIAR